MSLLSDINNILLPIGVPVETGVFSSVPPDEYLVITPLADVFDLFADNRPRSDIQDARISLFTKSNYLQRIKQIISALLDADFTITARRYIGHEDDTGLHNYAIDISKNYNPED